MGDEKLKKNIGLRYLNEEGIMMYFCKMCGTWKPESSFYRKKNGVYGKNEVCRSHYLKNNRLTKEEREAEQDNKHLHYSKLTDEDFENTQEFLRLIGYDTASEKSVHIQFMEKWIYKKIDKV